MAARSQVTTAAGGGGQRGRRGRSNHQNWRSGVIHNSFWVFALGSMWALSPGLATAQTAPVPLPMEIQWGEGGFELTPEATILLQFEDSVAASRLGGALNAILLERAGFEVPILTRAGEDQAAITLSMDRAGGGPPESYGLTVTPGAVSLTAPDEAGLFRGLQTLRQLIEPADGRHAVIPLVTIEDQPRFSYRGMHLDVSRHFFDVSFVKRYIDLLARYKFNTFHWHLTEDQGWRLAIERYPRLTEVASCRRETMVEKNFDPYVGDGTPYCGFYTADEVRKIVAYAADRYITVIPEIEMPGHSLAALAAYPELACTPGPFEVGTRWGVFEDIYCPTEATFEFLEGVLDEVLALFPSPFIHIGGDEAPKARWRESAEAQAVIEREGLADEAELQSWFIRRIERYLNARGRRLIGWDEILEGGLAPDATVMSWRGMAGGIEASRQGHDVIMTPGSHVYFDHYQGDPRHEPLAIGGFTPLAKVYAFEPVPPELTPAEARHVIGAQANLWTEYIPTEAHAEYMALPRMLALSEVVWSPADARDWQDFRARLAPRLEELDRLGVRYRVPGVEGLEADRLSLEPEYPLRLTTLRPDGVIRYTLDGSVPDTSSLIYEEGLMIPVSDSGTVVTARVFLPGGRTSPVSSATIRGTTLRPAVQIAEMSVRPGLRYELFEGRLRTLGGLDELAPAPSRSGIVRQPALTGDEPAEGFALRFRGLLNIDEAGVYEFELVSDDGSRLVIGGQVVVDHDGLHSARGKRGSIALAAGLHPLGLDYFQAGGGKALELRLRLSGESRWRGLDELVYHGGS